MRRPAVLLAAAVLATVATWTHAGPATAEGEDVWDRRALKINGTYAPVVGQFAGDAAMDVLWYAPGTASDMLWIGNEGGRGLDAFTRTTLTINGRYTPVVGDFAGDGYDDIFWYAPGSTPDPLWVSVDDPDAPFTTVTKSVSGTFRPFVLEDYRGAGGGTAKDRIFWYAPGPAADSLWRFAADGSGKHTSGSHSVTSTVVPVVGDWNADRIEDVLLYGAGTVSDGNWISTETGFTKSTPRISGTYRPATVYTAGADGILWFGDGTRPDSYWAGSASGFTTRRTDPLDSVGTPHSAGLGSVIVYSPTGPELGFVDGTVFPLAPGHDIGSGITPLIADFDGDGHIDVFWYGPGTRPDSIWYSVPEPLASGPDATAAG